jgi:hypothetical protein
VLGAAAIVSGAWPTWQAMRTDPVFAIRVN